MGGHAAAARTLRSILAEHGLSHVDWFKTDSQGTDLRLFLSLGEPIVRRVLAASFEPGLIDAYVGEDKLHAVLQKMNGPPFWMHDIEVRGTQRLSRRLWEDRVDPLARCASARAEDGAGLGRGVASSTRCSRAMCSTNATACSLGAGHRPARFCAASTAGQERFADAIFGALAHESLSNTVRIVDCMLPPVAKKAIGVLRYVRDRLLRPNIQ